MFEWKSRAFGTSNSSVATVVLVLSSYQEEQTRQYFSTELFSSLRTPTWKCGSTTSCVIKPAVSDVLNKSGVGDWLANPTSLLA